MKNLLLLGLAGVLALGCGGADPVTGDDANVIETKCTPVPACDAALPDLGEAEGFDHTGSKVTAALGAANHRGRDLILLEGEPQWVIGKFAYGLTDKDLKDEVVDIYLLRGCGEEWEWLGEALTTDDGDHETVLGVKDNGGRVYFQIPDELQLEPGRHRIHLAVRGDLSGADLFVQIVEPGTKAFVSDVDGTLTTSEAIELGALLVGALPKAHADAGKALSELADEGYLPIYVTARPEQGVQRTRDFLEQRGFPPGIVHTTLSSTGALGSAASSFKKGELAELAKREVAIDYAFGNTATDAEAYESAGIEREHRFFYQFEDKVSGGTRIESYTSILDQLADAPSACD